MNIFEQAAILKFRFASNKGPLATEQLFDMPLSSKTGFDLDSVAKTVNQELKAMAEESFVATASNPAKTILETKLEVVKHVIATKMKLAQDNQEAAARASERNRLREILGQKEDQALLDLSPEELKKRLAALGG
jgi:membrane glycosyltransferase